MTFLPLPSFPPSEPFKENENKEHTILQNLAARKMGHCQVLGDVWLSCAKEMLVKI